MRRTGITAVVFVLFGLLAGAAQAKNVSEQHVSQKQDDVVAYWTQARMKGAVPADRARQAGSPKGAAGKGGKTATYPYTSFEVQPPYTAFPASTNGKVFFTEKGVDYVCSGTALTSGNHSVVWTAGHCVNEGPGAFVTNWSFVPAYRDGARPLGTWTARDLLTTTQWQSTGDFSYDLGAAVVNTNGASTLTDVTGGRGIAFNYDANQHYVSYGYPAAKPFNGQRLWACDAQLGTRDTSLAPPSMGIGCNMTGGSSGGGWIVGNDVYSVNSYHYTQVRDVMYGPYQGSVAQDLFNRAASR